MKIEIQGLLHKAEKSLSASKKMLQDDYTDIAASRAYYVMFYCAEALLKNMGLKLHKHSAVISAFGKEFAKTGKLDVKFHRYLMESFNERLTADYHALEHVTEETAEKMIKEAEEFLEATKKYIEQHQDNAK